LIKISYKYRFSLEFNQSITKQESSFILTKRNTKMIRKYRNSLIHFLNLSNKFWNILMREIRKIHNSSIFYFSYFVFLIPLERDKNRFGESETILFYRKIEL
ncbi:hypothetical protein ACJX0J_003618, partial [Zea mays]